MSFRDLTPSRDMFAHQEHRARNLQPAPATTSVASASDLGLRTGSHLTASLGFPSALLFLLAPLLSLSLDLLLVLLCSYLGSGPLFLLPLRLPSLPLRLFSTTPFRSFLFLLSPSMFLCLLSFFTLPLLLLQASFLLASLLFLLALPLFLRLSSCFLLSQSFVFLRFPPCFLRSPQFLCGNDGTPLFEPTQKAGYGDPPLVQDSQVVLGAMFR